MLKHFLYILLLLLFLADVVYSFKQHYHAPMDGDMPSHILPDAAIKPVLDHPLGLYAIIHHKAYADPNRFFCHWSLKTYFDHVPFWLQKAVSPIKSLYLSCAIAKTIFQIGIIWLLAVMICGTFNILKLDFIVSAALIFPLFQTFGFNTICIIDYCPTYAFSYAFPCLLIGLYFLPYIFEKYHGKKINIPWPVRILWIPFALVVSLNGPLNPGIALVFGLLAFIFVFNQNYWILNKHSIFKRVFNAFLKIQPDFWFYFLPIALFSLYSLYVGKFNSQSLDCQRPLKELYLLLPKGIYHEFADDYGFKLLFILLIINIFLIHYKVRSTEGKKILKLFKWIGLFSVIYIVLLPLGGYRPYRPYLLRCDTIMPVTLCVFFIFGLSTLYLFNNLSAKLNKWYIPVIILGLLVYTIKDFRGFGLNYCEKSSLEQIAASKDTVVELNNNCSVVSWSKISKPEDSELQSEILLKWHVTKRKKLFYSK